MIRKSLVWIIVINLFFVMTLSVYQAIMIWSTISRGQKILAEDIKELQDIVQEYNTLPKDKLKESSIYQGFVEVVLRNSEDSIYKYDVEVSNGNRVTNNKELLTKNYTGTNIEQNPIKIYYFDEDGNKVYVDSFTNAPQRGTALEIELSMNIYVPVIFQDLRTKDQFSQNYSRRLYVITKKTGVIGSESYKGR